MRRRVRPGASRREAIEAAERMMRDGLCLRLLLAKMPDGAALDDARELRRRIPQRGCRPSRVLARRREPHVLDGSLLAHLDRGRRRSRLVGH